MKRILHILIAIITLGFVFSCEPVEDRNSLPAITKTAADLKFTVTAKSNSMTLENLDLDVIPYWSYTDALGNELGHFNTNKVADIALPFAGTYYVNFTAYTRGGIVEAEPKKVVISQNDLTLFSDPKWDLLTNGVKGKTWILKMSAPLEFVGSGYINSTVGGDWNWYPNFSDISWAGIEDKDWGEITFNLNGGYNVTVVQTSTEVNSTTKTTKKGTFSYNRTADFTNDRIILNGGLEMLHPGPTNSWNSGFSFSNVRLVELTATTLSYAAIRADGQVLIYHLIAK
nr:hypothetical protein [uncultured Flavobacterium sp.]